MKITKRAFGKNPPALLYTLTNDSGASVSLTEYGASIVSARLPDSKGDLADVALGYGSAEEYAALDGCLGSVCGRVANRLEGACFTLNAARYSLWANNGGNTLHGGKEGFHKKLWTSKAEDGRVIFEYISEHGEENFPGRLECRIEYAFGCDNTLTLKYSARSDADTVVNLTNHAYFNLAGHGSGDVHGHELWINADFYTPMKPGSVTDGSIVPVAHTPFDFRSAKEIGRDIGADCEQLRLGGGYDHNFVLNKTERGAFEKAAVLSHRASGRTLTVYTTLPGVQLYTANSLTERKGKEGAQYSRRCGVCLETQYFPNSMVNSHFPSPVLRAGEAYEQKTAFAFGTL